MTKLKSIGKAGSDRVGGHCSFLAVSASSARFSKGPAMIAALKVSARGVALGLASLVATAVHAQDSGTIVVEGERDKNSRKICKSTAPPTGTRLGARRICRTAAEWKIVERRTQEIVEHDQQRQRAVDAYKANAKNALASPGPP